MIPHKEQKTPGAEPRGGREMACTWQATASSLDLNQYSYLYTVRNMPKDLLFQPAMPLWSKGIAQECSSCVIPTWKGTMVPPFQVSVHQHIFLGEVLQSSWLVMNQLPTCSRTHPSQACQSVCAALLPCAGLVGSTATGGMHSSTSVPFFQVHYCDLCNSQSHAEIFQAIMTRNWYTRCCFPLTASRWPLARLTQVTRAAGVDPTQHEERVREWNQARLHLPVRAGKFWLSPLFCPFNHLCHFSKEVRSQQCSCLGPQAEFK